MFGKKTKPMIIGLTLAIAGFCSWCFAQEAPVAPASQIDISIQTILSLDTPVELRQSHAVLLLKDPASHQPIVDKILMGQNHIEAKIIICKALASQHLSSTGLGQVESLPTLFTQPLFGLLGSDDSELSKWSARALVRCRNGVTDQLGAIITNSAEKPKLRIAAMDALKLIPGKDAVKVLADALSDTDPQIAKQASEAMAQMLCVTYAVDAQQYKDNWKSYIENVVDEKDFIIRQLEWQRKQYQQTKVQLTAVDQQSQLWKQRFLSAESAKFDRLNTQGRQDLLLSYINGKDEDMLIWALEQMAKWAQTTPIQKDIASKLVEQIKPLIESTSDRIRVLTGQVLLGIDKDIISPLAAELLERLKKEDSNSWQVQIAFIDTLGKIGYQPAIETIAAIGNQANNSPLAAANVRALAKIFSAESNTIDKTQAEQIFSVLTKETQWSEVKFEQCKAIRNMSEYADYYVLIKGRFEQFLKNSLADKNAMVRSQAVPALANIEKNSALGSLLKPVNMLDDEDRKVRFAVIPAIGKYGNKDHLPILRQRLNIDLNAKDTEAADQIYSAMKSILDNMTIADNNAWLGQLDATGQDSKLEIQAINSLREKINKAVAQGKVSEAEILIEINAMIKQATVEMRNGQFSQAALTYKQLSDKKLNEVQGKLVSEAMISIIAHNDLKKSGQFIDVFGKLSPVVVAELATSQQSQDKLIGFFAGLKSDNDIDLEFKSQLLISFIVPLKTFPQAQTKTLWQENISRTAKEIVQLQLSEFAANKNDNLKAVELLVKLKPELVGYDPKAEIAVRKTTMEKFLTILNPPATVVKEPAK
ncbi:MAG: HEAT repeat domain-containing protein [Phycisphaerae bacterium]|nr:HEAT repeat domain-containing protein [Phycisphaerae bacterium]